MRFIAGTGCRKGEALALSWDDLLGNDQARIAHNLARVNGQIIIKAPKTKASLRTIDILPPADQGLELASALQAADRAASRHWSNPRNLIFTTESGEPIDPRNALRDFETVTDKAGVPEGPLHSLRHTFATLLLESGADIEAVSRQLGHARTSITMDVYRHIRDSDRSRELHKHAGALTETASKAARLRVVGE